MNKLNLLKMEIITGLDTTEIITDIRNKNYNNALNFYKNVRAILNDYIKEKVKELIALKKEGKDISEIQKDITNIRKFLSECERIIESKKEVKIKQSKLALTPLPLENLIYDKDAYSDEEVEVIGLKNVLSLYFFKKQSDLSAYLGYYNAIKRNIKARITKLENSDGNKEDILVLKKYLKDLINTFKKSPKKQATVKKEDIKEEVLSPNKMSIYYSFKQGIVDERTKIKDYIEVLGYFISNASETEIQDNLEILFNNIKYDLSEEERNLIHGLIKKRLNKHLDKKTIRILKSIQKFLNLYEVKEEVEKHNYLYDIIDFWLSNESNEYYILEFLRTSEEVYKLEDIAQIILQKYIDACKEELKNQKSDYVSKDYYLKIYNNLVNNPLYQNKEQAKLQKMIDEFIEFIKNSKYKPERKQQILETTSKLVKKEEPLPQLSEVEEKDILEQSSYAMAYYIDAKNDKNRMNFTSHDAIIINDDNASYAYSIDYTKDGSVLLRIHVLDIAALTYEDTPIECDMKNNNQLHKNIIDSYKLKEGKTSPVITYQLNIRTNGTVYDFKVFRSIITPKHQFNPQTPYQEVKKDESLMPYVMISRQLKDAYDLESDDKTIEGAVVSNINQILEKMICRDLKKKNIPFIYRVQEQPDINALAYQITKLNWLMHRVSTETFQTVYHTICNHNNTKSHFDINDIGHYNLDRRNLTAILKPFTYMGLKSQQLLIDAYINEISTRELINRYASDIANLANYYNKKLYDYQSFIIVEDSGKQKVK